MSDPGFIILYVADALASARFYTDLLDKPATDTSPNFVFFALDSGVNLGLWARDRVDPKVTAAAGSGELAFAVANNAMVDTIHFDWRARGMPILQTPIALDFGYTFVALDPDGHRLRVLAMG